MWIKIAIGVFVLGGGYMLLNILALGAMAGRSNRDAQEVLEKKRREEDMGDLDYIERPR